MHAILTAPAGLKDFGARLSAAMAAPRWSFLDLLERQSVPVAGRRILVVPVAPSDSEASAIRALIAVLRSAGDVSHKFRAPKARLPRRLRAIVSPAADADEFDIFSLGEQLVDELRLDNLRVHLNAPPPSDGAPEDHSRAGGGLIRPAFFSSPPGEVGLDRPLGLDVEEQLQ
jgi:hypothetical protein